MRPLTASSPATAAVAILLIGAVWAVAAAISATAAEVAAFFDLLISSALVVYRACRRILWTPRIERGRKASSL